MKTQVYRYSLIFSVLILASNCQQKKETMQKDIETEVVSETVRELKVSDIIIPEGNKPIECRNFRLRRLDVIPGGKIPIHSHENRPAILCITKGEGMKVHAYQHDPVDVLYAEGYAEYNTIVHYAENLSNTEMLSLATFDLLDDGSSCESISYQQNTVIFDMLKNENNSFFANAPHSIKDETNHPIYSIPISEIVFPEGKAGLMERRLRVRKVTLGANEKLENTNYQNRPSFIFVLEGNMELKRTDENLKETLGSQQTAELVNERTIEIRNSSADNPLVYFVLELWDPADKELI